MGQEHLQRTVNQVILLGRLAVLPERMSEEKGLPVCRMQLVTEEWTHDAAGALTTRTEHHVLQAEGALADFCLQRLVPGQQLYIEGVLRRNEQAAHGQPWPVVVHVQKLLVASWKTDIEAEDREPQ
ncbi:single-strand DNA-binding protein [Rhodothermus profundi]|uniref:Single-strand DNA-binding protein n=2 Tax=Rhodothermus profundi TaxID=633813 RepID=A0A1M6SM28_9BACT|nr:single-strand DNA-binding protein [Rhodothermus profundi]